MNRHRISAQVPGLVTFLNENDLVRNIPFSLSGQLVPNMHITSMANMASYLDAAGWTNTKRVNAL
jgi:hypothetical protein